MQKLRKDCKKSMKKTKSSLNLRNKITNESMVMLPEDEKSKGEEIKITMMNSYEYSIIYFLRIVLYIYRFLGIDQNVFIFLFSSGKPVFF